MKTSWQFFTVVASTPSGFTWQWQKLGAEKPAAGAGFDFYFDCISDARRNGYTGPLPPAAKVPLERWPVSPEDVTEEVLTVAPIVRTSAGGADQLLTIAILGGKPGSKQRHRVSIKK